MSRKPDFVDPKTGKEYRVGGYVMGKTPSKLPLFGAPQTVIQNLPHSVDLRQLMSPIEEQEVTNTCVAAALAGAYEFLIKKNKGIHVDVSRLFMYYNGRIKYGFTETNMSDSGCNIGTAVEGLKEFGCCKEDIYPFKLELVNKKPPKYFYQQAINHRVTESYSMPTDLSLMKSCLAEGFPFAFGIMTYETFKAAGSNGGRVELPNFANDSLNEEHGHHAMLAVGYSDASKCFIVRNSWGPTWGDHGYCYIPYSYMRDPSICLDLQVIKGLSSDIPQISPSDSKIENMARWYHYDANYLIPTSNKPRFYPKTFFWMQNDNFNYMTATWSKNRLQLSTSDESVHSASVILWLDVKNQEHTALEKVLKKSSQVTVEFREKYSEGERYLQDFKDTSGTSTSLLIICHGSYPQEKKTPLDILALLDYLGLKHVPVIAFTSKKEDLENRLKEQTKSLPIKDWNKRLFITTDPQELLSMAKHNINRVHS